MRSPPGSVERKEHAPVGGLGVRFRALPGYHLKHEMFSLFSPGMTRLFRQAQSCLLVLLAIAACLAAYAYADGSEPDEGSWDFSHNYEGHLERIARNERDLDVFKVRGYPIFFIEFHSAAIQSESLDRIGIFVESDGYSGKILAPQLMKTLNEEAFFDGHDYASEDLARFYSLAARYAIRLHPMEIHIRELLIRLGVIAEKGGEYVPKMTAALLTAVRGLDERHGAGTRRWVLNHEFRHGYYFVTMKDDVHGVWDDMLSHEEQKIIASTLRRTARYNPNDESLMEREFHAMVFEERFEEDLQGLWTRGFDFERAPKKEDVDALIEKLPAIRRAFNELERKLMPESAGISID